MTLIIKTTVKNKELVRKRRTQIVHAAITLFAKKGYHNTTLKDLAVESGIAYGNIYDYVGCKEDILILIHSFLNEVASESLFQSLSGVEHPLEKLKISIKAELNLLHEWNDAVLLLYRETHVLLQKRPYLSQILHKERDRLENMEVILMECIEKGYIRQVNIRLTANLIKILCEVCVLKRWDLRGHTTKSEIENHIMNFVFQSLVNQEKPLLRAGQNVKIEEVNSILLINGGTQLAKPIITFLSTKGLKLAIYNEGKVLCSTPMSHNSRNIKWYFGTDVGPIYKTGLAQIYKDFGPVNVIIQDLGFRNSIPCKKANRREAEIESSLRSAQELAPHLELEMARRGRGRILYLAPWAWDQDVNSLRYQMVKAGVVSLTKAMAQRLLGSKVSVNCLIPGLISGVRPLGSRGADQRRAEYKENWRGNEVEITELMKIIDFLISEDSNSLTGQVLEVGQSTRQ